MAGTVTMGKRAISVSPQTAALTAAATYNWLPKATKGKVRPMTEWDTVDLLTYTRATQREADPKTIYMMAEVSGLIDAYLGFLLCGVAGQPTSGVWTIGKDDPDLLTVTEASGLATSRQLIDGLVTSLVLHNTPADGRMSFEARIVGAYAAPITTPSVTIPSSVVFRAGQCLVKRGGTAIRAIASNLSVTQDGDPLFTNPDTVTGSTVPFAQADEIESFGVTARFDALQKYTAYAASSIAAAEAGTLEAWIWDATRPDLSPTVAHRFLVTMPKVVPGDPDTDNAKPRIRASTAGPIILDSGIAGLATIAITGDGVPSFAKS